MYLTPYLTHPVHRKKDPYTLYFPHDPLNLGLNSAVKCQRIWINSQQDTTEESPLYQQNYSLINYIDMHGSVDFLHFE